MTCQNHGAAAVNDFLSVFKCFCLVMEVRRVSVSAQVSTFFSYFFSFFPSFFLSFVSFFLFPPRLSFLSFFSFPGAFGT